MDIFQIDDDGRLFISPAIDNWDALAQYGIDTVIDLEGGIDAGVPEVPGNFLYIYFPIHDGQLPNLTRLHAVAIMVDLRTRRDLLLARSAMGEHGELGARLVTAHDGTIGAQHKQTFDIECEVSELGLVERGIGASRRAGEQAAAAAMLMALKAKQK